MKTAMASVAAQPAPAATAGAERGQIGDNIAAVHDFYKRQEHRLTNPQLHVETIGGFVGRPAFLVVILLFVVIWTGANGALIAGGKAPFDEAPFFWLQGLIALAALLTTTVPLIKQDRVDKLGEQRAHLDLKVMLLIEQKTAKLIDLMEELRRDMPDVKNRTDSGAAFMQQAMSPERVLAALAEEVTSPDGSNSISTAAPAAPAGPTVAQN